LGEQNNFGKEAIKKPYSIILAEQKTPKRKSRLALASTELDKEAMSGNTKIPGKSRPSNNQSYVQNERVILRDGSSDKEYTVRIYESDQEPGIYEVWAFNGKTNQTQSVHPKGRYHSLGSAKSKASEIMWEKKGKGYADASDYSLPSANPTIPGKEKVEGEAPEAKKVAPKKTVKKKKVAPKPKPEDKSPKDVTDDEAQQIDDLMESILEDKGTSDVNILSATDVPKRIEGNEK